MKLVNRAEHGADVQNLDAAYRRSLGWVASSLVGGNDVFQSSRTRVSLPAPYRSRQTRQHASN